MNLNQITSGTDYAFFPSRGRGEEFRWCDRDNSTWYDGTYSDRYFVYRVKAIRTFSQREIGNKRDTGYVEVFWLTNDGEFKYDNDGEYVQRTVRVRDLATLWEDYEDMHDYEKVRRDKREAEHAERQRQAEEKYEREKREHEAIRLEREATERAEQLRIEQERQLYVNEIEKRYNLPTGSVTVSLYGITLNKDMIDADLTKTRVWSNNGK